MIRSTEPPLFLGGMAAGLRVTGPPGYYNTTPQLALAVNFLSSRPARDTTRSSMAPCQWGLRWKWRLGQDKRPPRGISHHVSIGSRRGVLTRRLGRQRGWQPALAGGARRTAGEPFLPAADLGQIPSVLFLLLEPMGKIAFTSLPGS